MYHTNTKISKEVKNDKFGYRKMDTYNYIGSSSEKSNFVRASLKNLTLKKCKKRHLNFINILVDCSARSSMWNKHT